jgi:hypothetical protein
MDRNPARLYKLLVVGVIVLFIGVGVQPAFAVDVSVSKTSDNEKECNKKHNSIGLGFIMVVTGGGWPISPYRTFYIPVGFVSVSCIDLDTGYIRYGTTRFLSFYIFKFLKRGHSFKISSESSYFDADDVYINNLSSFKVVELLDEDIT